MKSKLKNIIKHLKERKEMYLFGNDSYSTLISFLIGFSIGAVEGDKNILNEFDDWLQVKEGKSFSLHWSSYILNELCNSDEEKAGKMVLELMEDFITQTG
ncbi:hypothetical protein [Aquimarina longa]|uniref:hypothetical protein n=1 Tax=Aquimarina longa TaxID=1080221 RepID=UPI0007825FCC|nr:hypothetical protein [Aquimarina longa]